jgi:hypothetical protein
MNTNEMCTGIADKCQHRAIKAAGITFLLSLIIPLLNWSLVQSKFIVTENAINTVHNILSNEFLFRIGIFNELITSVVAVVLALSLYMILKPVNKNLALLALLLKLTEAVLIAVFALFTFIALLILKGQVSFTAFEQEHIQTLVGLFLNVRISLSAISMVFLGLNLVIFLYLLLKSRYVPSLLAGFGILSYTLIFIYALMTILSPNYASIIIIQIICWAPSCLFELVIGLWLLIKGIKIPEMKY